jgi:plasmid stabilization system protein ParE
MTYRVIVTPSAESDLRTIYRYIRSRAPRAARDWIRRARQAVKTLAHHPERCPVAPESASFAQPIRELFVGSAIAAHIVFYLSCLMKRDRSTFCMYGMDRCSRSDLQRNIPMLLGRVLVPLILQHGQRLN